VLNKVVGLALEFRRRVISKRTLFETVDTQDNRSEVGKMKGYWRGYKAAK
jgi:hypothetical protein